MGVIIILSISVIILLTYLYFIKKEIKNIYKQLNEYNRGYTRKKIDISLFDRDIENLVRVINDHINISINAVIKQKNTEDELKRAIANISHDIRTPLTSILRYIQMSKREGTSHEKQLECINIAESKSNTLKKILEKLFIFSIVESPEYIIELEYINLNDILYELIASFYDEFKSNGMDLNIDIKEENLIVLGNKTDIVRIIENLMTNLVKYSKGNEQIELKKVDGKGMLIISNKVENLRKEDVKLLFNRFYKQDISRNSSKSSGLGLSITKTLIEKMKGDIDAYLIDDQIYIICSWKIADLK